MFNFTTLKDMLVKDTAQVHVHNPKKIKSKQVQVIVFEPETKDKKFVFKKRWLMENFDSLPYMYD